jgi:signal transduction histidine kinase
VRWTSPEGLGLIAAFMLPILVLAIVSIISVQQRANTRRLLVVETHTSAADLLSAKLDETLDEWGRQLLAELDAGGWEGRELLQSLAAAERAFPDLRPMVMIDPSGAVVYPRGARSALPTLSERVVQAAFTANDSYARLIERGKQSELYSEDLPTAERLYDRAVGVAEDDYQRVRALHALARTHLKAAEPSQATATWQRMLSFTDPLDSELARWGLIGRIGLAQAAMASDDNEAASEVRVEMLEYLTKYRFNLDPDVYAFYRDETEAALAELSLSSEQRGRVNRLMGREEELDRIATALNMLVRQAPQLGGMEGAVVVGSLDVETNAENAARSASEWTIAYLNLPNDSSGSTVISARGDTGWRLLRRWRKDSVTQILRSVLLEPGSWRGFGVALLDPSGAAVFATTETVPAERVEARVNLTALPGWRIATYPRDSTIDETARQDVFDYSVLLAAAFLAVVGGLILATRTVSREVALARTRSDFVSNVSHELKTPLALIRMFAENLRAGWVPDAKRSEYYEVMLSESERLSGVIDNVLDFSRMESGRREFHFRSTDVTALISGILERYRYSFETAGIELETALPSHAVVADVDRDGLAQVLVNLLSNAAKYIGEGRKQVMVSLAEDGVDLVIVVRDTGVGMSSDSVQEIFAPFTRIDDPEVHSVAGSGIGLTIVRHIVDAHRGHIDVDSRPQEGSTFRVRLPRHRRGRRDAPDGQTEESQ